jgi:hypothetical protein
MLFFVVQQANSAISRLMFEVSRSHTFRHTHTHTHGRLLRTNDQPVAEAATYTKHNKHNSRTSVFSGTFETAVTAIKLLHAYDLERLVTGICKTCIYVTQFR